MARRGPMHTIASPLRLARRLPPHLVNGLSVGLGLAGITAAIALLFDVPSALAASSGGAVVSIADTVAPPRAKTRPMFMAAAASLLVSVLVTLCHGHPVLMGVAVMAITFTAILWTAWGKRGGPLTFAMILAMVFQMSALDHGNLGGTARWAHWTWVGVGTIAMVAWALLSARLLAPRYQTLALADSLGALGRLMSAQADWMGCLGSRPSMEASDQDAALLPLVRQQAAIAEVLQQTRDLLYSQTAQASARRWIPGFIALIDLRDLLLACQLDLDRWPTGQPLPASMQQWQQELKGLGLHLAQMASAIARGRPLPPAPSPMAPEAPPSPAAPSLEAATLWSLQRRHGHLRHGWRRLADALTAAGQTSPFDASVLHALRSPIDWPLATLRASLDWDSPVLRHAARATAAMGFAYVLAHAMPWTSHPQWLLMTVAVIMRGNLEQTLARRDARVIGTLAGCVLATGLLAVHPSGWFVLMVLAIALSLAHAYALVDYRITSMAGAVLALLQSHSSTHQLMPLAAAERLGDTLVGAGLAWGFSYLWPAWEHRQLPPLVARLLKAQAQYAHHVLGQGMQSTLGARGSHARREVYDVVWLLTQSLQRMHKEPVSKRGSLRALEAVLVRSHRFTGQIAGVRSLLLARQADLDPDRTTAMLGDADQTLSAQFERQQPTRPAPETDDHATLPFPLNSEQPAATPSPMPWLARRLKQAEADARSLVHAAHAFMSPGK